MTTTPSDRADGPPITPAPPARVARDALPPSVREHRPAPLPDTGLAGHTSPPAGRPPVAPLPGGAQAPAGGARAVAPLAGQDFRDRVKAAQSAHAAAKRRGRFTRAAKQAGPGMIRRAPPDLPAS